MKLDIILESGGSSQSFCPGGQVRGRLEIRGRVFKRPPSINATLRGRLKLLVRPRGNAPPERVMHTLFEVSQQLEISNEISYIGPTEHKSNDWSQPDYSAPFEFIFPSASNSCQCQLPPSLHMASSLVRIKVEYTLVVAVRQNMLCRMTRTTRVQRELSLRSEAGTVFLPSSTIGCLPANKLCPKMNNALQEAYKSRFINPDWLPPYTPSLQVEVLFSSPPILTIGQPTQIQVVLHVPPELLEGENIYLRSAVMQLKSSVTTIVGTVSGSSTETHDLWSCRGRVHLDKRRLELDSGAWGSCVVLDTWPTCTSCVLDLKHAIEVVAGISRGDDQEIQYVHTSLDVLVMDPPPNYIPNIPTRADTPAQGSEGPGSMPDA
ncbi:hypothetical protein BKA56DRAFT_132929 [Ilyonectria sp. MPI-CAGE-AT-0026]|nr:hypothetical protein BKA56DRAFT_132929 [Ilyonectria sp. MPI-CAGE-AT-0026]